MKKTRYKTYNKCSKWTPESVALFAYAKYPPEPLSTYTERYVFCEVVANL